MPVYETSFLGEPVAVKPKKGKKNTKAPEPVQAEEPVQVADAPKPKPKRVVKRKAPEPEIAAPSQVQVEEPIPEPTEPPKKKKAVKEKPQLPILSSKVKKIVDGELANEAPAWFKTFLHEEAKRRNNKKPKGEKVTAVALKASTDAVVKEKWTDETTKPKVMQVDHKMNSMYRQIFGK